MHHRWDIYLIHKPSLPNSLTHTHTSCMPSGLTGILFFHHQEAAFSANRFWFGMGFSLGFLYALFVSAKVQIWLMVAHMAISIITYSVLTVKTTRKDQLLPCAMGKARPSNQDHWWLFPAKTRYGSWLLNIYILLQVYNNQIPIHFSDTWMSVHLCI